MKKENNILLPGLSKQLQHLIDQQNLENKKSLVIGSASELIAEKLAELTGLKTELIVEDFDSLMTSNLIVDKNPNVTVKMMDYDLTDFSDNMFDLVYAQGSISLINRKKILSEIKRILMPEGLLCVGELVLLEDNPPTFIIDIFENSGMEPLLGKEASQYYKQRGFKILAEKNLSDTLKEYYSMNLQKLESALEDLDENEKTYYKKVLNKISHESSAFLRQGADRYIGFRTMICKRSED